MRYRMQRQNRCFVKQRFSATCEDLPVDFFKRFQFSPWIMGGSLALALTCFYMSTWQFRRYEEKKVYFRALDAATVDTLPALEVEPANWESLLGERRTLRGSFDFDREMIVLNRTYNYKPGVKLVTPFRLAGSDRVVLVDRGFIIREESSAEARRKYHEPRGETRIMAIARQSREGGFFLSPPDHVLNAPDEGWFRMNVTRMQSYLPYAKDVAPVYFELIKTGEEYPIALVRDVLPPFRHLNYALQWISFGVFGLIMGLFVQFRRGAKRAKEAAAREATA